MGGQKKGRATAGAAAGAVAGKNKNKEAKEKNEKKENRATATAVTNKPPTSTTKMAMNQENLLERYKEVTNPAMEPDEWAHNVKNAHKAVFRASPQPKMRRRAIITAALLGISMQAPSDADALASWNEEVDIALRKCIACELEGVTKAQLVQTLAGHRSPGATPAGSRHQSPNPVEGQTAHPPPPPQAPATTTPTSTPPQQRAEDQQSPAVEQRDGDDDGSAGGTSPAPTRPGATAESQAPVEGTVEGTVSQRDADDDGAGGDADDDGAGGDGHTPQQTPELFPHSLNVMDLQSHAIAIRERLDNKLKPPASNNNNAPAAGATTFLDAVRPAHARETIKIDPSMAQLLATIRNLPSKVKQVPDSGVTEIMKGNTQLAQDGHEGFASYDLMAPFMTTHAAVEAAPSAIKRAMLAAKTCCLIVRDDIGKSTVALMSGVPSASASVALTDRRVQAFRFRASSSAPRKVLKGTVNIREVTMRVVGSKEDVNAFATANGLRWSFERAFERNGKTQMQVVGGLTGEQASAVIDQKKLLMIPDACVTADYAYDRMITIDFKREVGPEQAQAFLLEMQREHSCMSTILMFRGRVLMPTAVTHGLISTLKDKHKDVVTNVRCPALGRTITNKRPIRQAEAVDEDDTLSVAPAAIAPEHRETAAQTQLNAIIAKKVEGDASPYMTSNQANTLEKELVALDKGAKKLAFDGIHAMYVVPDGLLKLLELDDGQDTAAKPAEHFMHFELSDGTVLALRTLKSHQKIFEELRARREQSLANNAAAAASPADPSHAQ